MKVDGLSIAGAILSILLVIAFFSILFSAKIFPFLQSPIMVVAYALASKAISASLWSLRVLDVIILGIIFFSSAMGCIALFRLESEK
ncbi:hypothetical protein DRO51_03030 [Candidatus Bathyarchaeota archaeon]|nr:MAG: hypothetical protein DRO51_03030 [Candidatus Bathyarchaeota archaeon]